LQLFIAGRRDKLFMIVTVGSAGRGPRMDADLAKLAGETDFAGRHIGDLVAAQGRATAETLPGTAAQYARFTSTASTRRRSANCSCISCWRRSSPRISWPSMRSTSRRSRRSILAKRYLAGA